ncbi:unnamed protein product [Prorocentrum cordatum]|uniref:Uncharacterized protein n=1 Tax=Prorocentrum cordatum TaxID=2364126 RepID=A0ABN9QEL2_9DINO|nr:unnamed protein product [Polarella glacialis]
MAGMLALMNMDDGGRRVDNMGLKGGDVSPEHAAFSSMGARAHKEPLRRHAAEEIGADDKRRERDVFGHVPFELERRVPDVGGLGWRTKSGQMIKNQTFYSQRPKVNKWDDPTFSGVNTWKAWHGPRLRTDADTMERLDRFEAETTEWEAKRTFVNTSRAETLDRFYNQKLNRTQRETAGSWAPQRRARREVHSLFETFDARLDEQPVKELKKVLTSTVLKRDREAMRMIAARMQNEETWKKVFTDIEQERRHDIRADLQLRQAHTDRLMLLSGAPVAERSSEDVLQPAADNSCLGDRLSRTAIKAERPDVSLRSDFRGLIHADNEHALETLFPGSGHELSVEFRERINRSTEPGWPRPPRAATPVHGGTQGARERGARSEEVAMASIPTSPTRLGNVGSRRNDEMLAAHAKAQFRPTVAPPPLDQSKTLLGEDWSASTVLRGGGSRVTGSFSRTSHVNASRSEGDLPPPRRRMVYPVLAPTSPHSRAPVDVSHMSSMTHTSSLHRSASVPAMAASTSRSGRAAAARATAEVCGELDSWEANTAKVPGINNFFGPPRASRHLRSEPSGTFA